MRGPCRRLKSEGATASVYLSISAWGDKRLEWDANDPALIPTEQGSATA